VTLLALSPHSSPHTHMDALYCYYMFAANQVPLFRGWVQADWATDA
jgi:hypothetical protein